MRYYERTTILTAVLLYLQECAAQSKENAMTKREIFDFLATFTIAELRSLAEQNDDEDWDLWTCFSTENNEGNHG